MDYRSLFRYTMATPVALMLLLMLGCQDTEKIDSPLEPAPEFDTSSDVGKEIKSIFDTYNLQFHYEWDRYAFARDVIADPADVNDVLPYIEIFKILFIDAIEQVSDEKFIQDQTPINIFLLGSGINYGGLQAFGESTAGQAGNIQPNRLTLGGLNTFGDLLRGDDDDAFLSYILENHVSSFPSEGGEVGFIYHEYTHYIDSKNDIPKDFEKPAFDAYLRGTTAYRRVEPETARERGFMLPYGMQNEHEDFATYVQIMLWKPRAEIEESYLLSDAAKEKYRLTYEYFLNYGLDLFELHDYLYSDAVKDLLLELKHKYDGSESTE